MPNLYPWITVDGIEEGIVRWGYSPSKALEIDLNYTTEEEGYRKVDTYRVSRQLADEILPALAGRMDVIAGGVRVIATPDGGWHVVYALDDTWCYAAISGHQPKGALGARIQAENVGFGYAEAREVADLATQFDIPVYNFSLLRGGDDDPFDERVRGGGRTLFGTKNVLKTDGEVAIHCQCVLDVLGNRLYVEGATYVLTTQGTWVTGVFLREGVDFKTVRAAISAAQAVV